MSERPLTAQQLSDALGCFWNAAISEARNQQDGHTFAAIMATGIAAVQLRLLEIAEEPAAPIPTEKTVSMVKPLKWSQSNVFGRQKRRGTGVFGEFCSFDVEDLSPGEISDREAEYQAKYEACIRSAFDSPILTVPKGWKLIPLEPTFEMLRAGFLAAREARYQDPCGKTEYDRVPRAVHYAMHTTAPEVK